ncbi:similar to chaperone protein dnaJ [Aromatoleum aromaticum EbN1]|uniref:Chaperone protein DnaJ 1 n=1 Tax=Aromatoleum aromaticum (strain DSM 19018 / LMG 30748 / EbN1) TaxID=76114 RepID=DNAJ1_AROAE|nr:DnaJ C-terminal domain-containing protein [Aromatoleum aromaticum]Q5P3M1.1 RecName: Full=Chaperone protein DnaJ 1 [Aromatoleum aromaticum EbN1]CAI08093.1 similar to chaperone protein dnaJ [Aromatoleum aromaticum EbN1]
MSPTDPHSLLGLSPGAGEREIKHAFRRLAMRWHPDRNADPAAIEHFKRLRAAYEDLLAEYSRCPAPAAAPHDAQAADARPEPPPEAPPRGADRREDLVLTMEEAFAGGEKAFTIADEIPCGACGGSGEEVLRHTRLCATCHGSGRVRDGRSLTACADCAGRGYLSRQACGACHGSGQARAARKLHVRIPAGVLDGDELRVAGADEDCDRSGGEPGDLILRVVLAPHALYRLDGRDLILSRPVSAFRMLLGGELPIPLPDGVRHLKLESGRATTRELRVKGAGFPGRGKQRAGALIVRLVPVLPEAPDAEILALLEIAESRLQNTLSRHLPDVASWEERWLPDIPETR